MANFFNLNYRHCKRCSGDYPEVCFDKRGLACQTVERRLVCNMCIQTERDERKRKNRWIDKARSTLRRHADKYIKLGHATSTKDFTSKFGWAVEKLSHDLEHAYENQCKCGESYKDMGHGLRDIELDIIDPRQPPYYTNTQPLCHTCNVKKAATPPHEWGAKMVGWKLWKENKEKIKRNELPTPEMFERAGIKLPVQLAPS